MNYKLVIGGPVAYLMENLSNLKQT
jgi:hypothetical protein